MEWEIIYYESQTGRTVVMDFIDSLSITTQAKLARQLDLLETYGNQLGMPHARAMGDGLMELRVRGQLEVRIFYVFILNKKIYLLHGFIKKSQTTPNKELAIARTRHKEVRLEVM